MSRYSDIECEKQLRSADCIIGQWCKDRISMVRQLDNDTANPFNLLPCAECASSAGRKAKAFSKPGTCVACKILSNLFENGDILCDTPFTIAAGNHSGQTFTLSCEKNAKFTRYSLQKPEEYPIYSELMKGFVSEWWMSSGYGHPLLIASVLENEMAKNNLKNIILFRWAYSCGNDLLIINSQASLVDYSFLEQDATEKVWGILLQLAVQLNFLTLFNYNHGSPSLKYMAFSSRPTSYSYKGKAISSPVTLHLTPGEYTSITTTNRKGVALRLYQGGEYVNHTPINVMPRYILGKNNTTHNTAHLKDYYAHRVLTYKISVEAYTTLVQRKGLAILTESYDLYAFWASLMTIPLFREAVFKDERLNSLWQSLFQPEELNAFNAGLDQVANVNAALSSVYLRVDALKEVCNFFGL